jgi:type VI protein secretion system component VasF
MPVTRKHRTWLESHNYRRHRRRREFWLVFAAALAFAAVVSWLLWAMS